MYFATNFCTGLFLLERFINNRKTSSGAILFTAILYSLFKYSNKFSLFSWYAGGARGGGGSLFLDQTDARRAKKILF